MNKSLSNIRGGVYGSYFEKQNNISIWRIVIKIGNKVKDHYLVKESDVDDILIKEYSKYLSNTKMLIS